jgi:hypothetical protein
MNLRGELRIKYTLYNQFASEKRLPAEVKEHLLGCGGSRSERIVITNLCLSDKVHFEAGFTCDPVV